MQNFNLFELTDSTDRMSEEILPDLLQTYESHALHLITQQEFQEALIHLKKCESIMETASAQGTIIKSSNLVSILNNIAVCYQSLNQPKKAENYADACFYNSRSTDFQPKFIQFPDLSLKTQRFIAKLSLQFNLLVYKTAPKKSKEILQISEKISGICIKQTFKACQRKVAQSSEGQKKSEQKLVVYKRALPLLEELNSFVEKKVMRKIKIRSSIGVQSQPDWTADLDFEKFLKFQPISCKYFKESKGLQEEVLKDVILEKIFLYLTSLFYIGVNFRLEGQFMDAMKYVKYAEELAVNFFGEESEVSLQIKKEIKVIDGAKNRACRMKRNSSVLGKVRNKENVSKELKTKAAYSNYKKEFQRNMSAGKIKKHRSESCSMLKEISSISFSRKKSELD